jgi:hypothetical protein
MSSDRSMFRSRAIESTMRIISWVFMFTLLVLFALLGLSGCASACVAFCDVAAFAYNATRPQGLLAPPWPLGRQRCGRADGGARFAHLRGMAWLSSC